MIGMLTGNQPTTGPVPSAAEPAERTAPAPMSDDGTAATAVSDGSGAAAGADVPAAGTADRPAPMIDYDRLPETLIQRQPGWHFVNVRELWRSREVLYCLVWRDIKVRYKQTILGVAWAFVQPLMSMAVFTLFIGRIGGIKDGIENYPLYVFAGTLLWTFLSNSMLVAGNSIVANERLITKVYFARLHVPFSAIGSALFDFVVALPLLLGFAYVCGVWPNVGYLVALLSAGLMLMLALGAGALLAALIAAQRDFRYILSFMVQLWMFATPAIYAPSTVVGEVGRVWFPLNPAQGLIENFRQGLLGGPINWYSLAVSGSMAVVISLIGLIYFRRVERSFADVI